jgi:SAM-dependent methyltransferase
MYNEDGVHYYKVGLSAISCIDEALERAGLKEVRSILDLPCGSGRVLRFLVHRFPDAEITACELASGAAEFCARTFGAQPAFSSLNLDEVSLGQKFDLIWCGSLVTHLNESGITALLRLFQRHLAPDGIMIFTTHGDFVQRRIPTQDFDYGLDAEQIRGIGVDYPNPRARSRPGRFARSLFQRARLGQSSGCFRIREHLMENAIDKHG